LRVVLAVAADPPRAETVVLLLDRASSGRTCVVCEGATTAEHVVELAGVLRSVADQEPAVAAVVLATGRPDGGIQPTAEDHAAFFELRATLGAAGVAVLDWFLLGDGAAASVAELVGGCWLWTDDEPQW
jgi:DNA repair protein RadC